MIKYEELVKLYYKKQDIVKELEKRLNNPCAYLTELEIFPISKGKRSCNEKYKLFYLPIGEILLLEEKIYRNSAEIEKLSLNLPIIARVAAIREIMVNEIIKTNGIEGVRTTKKDVYDSMTSKKMTRLSGIINKYKEIIENNIQKINSPEEIRELYEYIFSKDILENPENKLDGKIFRKLGIHISDGLKTIHIGDTSEEMILSHITELIKFMNKDDIQSLVKASIVHYYFEYIHPFYDGNGRFGRLLFSMYLARKTDIFTALSFSYSIFADKGSYSKLFLEVSNPKNCGEMTFFVKGMLEFVLKGQNSILEMLNEKSIKLNFALQYIESCNLSEIESKIISIYIQDYIFTERVHIKDAEILEYLPIKSKLTLKKHLNSLISAGYLQQVSKKPSQHSLSEFLACEFE
ncbi:MAG: Fic family protein [Cetobacterium sp.]